MDDTLSRALARVGATVVQRVNGDNETALFLRINLDIAEKWTTAVAGILLGSIGVDWKIDISKYFFAHQGQVKYHWRFVVRRDIEGCLRFIERCCLEAAQQHTKELTEFPLVGRATYKIDVALGKTKGPHGTIGGDGSDHISAVLSKHFIR